MRGRVEEVQHVGADLTRAADEAADLQSARRQGHRLGKRRTDQRVPVAKRDLHLVGRRNEAGDAERLAALAGPNRENHPLVRIEQDVVRRRRGVGLSPTADAGIEVVPVGVDEVLIRLIPDGDGSGGGFGRALRELVGTALWYYTLSPSRCNI